MDCVFCIVSKSSRVLFEVCGSEDVAREHLSADCYSIVREAGVELEIVKRVVWK